MNLRAQVGDPRRFVGKRIAKKYLFNKWQTGLVARILNMEGINSMFEVRWEDGRLETLRIIQDFLNGNVWLVGEQRSLANSIKSALLGKLSKIRVKKQQLSETVKDGDEGSGDTKYIP